MSDLISREAAKSKKVYSHERNEYVVPVAELDWLPSAQPEPKRGKWIEGKYMGFDGCFVWHRECSLCGYEREDDNPDKDTPFCPICGHPMERSEEWSEE